MPSYDYECTSCGYQFEEFQAMSDPVLTDCPECAQSSLKRLIGGGLGVIFKGSGFYVNDNRGAKKSSAGSGEASSTGSSSAGSSAKTNAAPSGGSGQAASA